MMRFYLGQVYGRDDEGSKEFSKKFRFIVAMVHRFGENKIDDGEFKCSKLELGDLKVYIVERYDNDKDEIEGYISAVRGDESIWARWKVSYPQYCELFGEEIFKVYDWIIEAVANEYWEI